MTIPEYIKQFAESKGFKIKPFEKYCGLANGAVSTMTANSRQTTFYKIRDHFPDFDIPRMFAECGLPYVGNITDEKDSQPSYADLTIKIKEQAETIASLAQKVSELESALIQKTRDCERFWKIIEFNMHPTEPPPSSGKDSCNNGVEINVENYAPKKSD